MSRLVPRWRARASRSWPRLLVRLTTCGAAVAAVTAVIEVVRPHAPVFSLGTLYVLAVLPVAVAWGRFYAVATSVVSMLVFNFVYLPPKLTFTLSGEENWVGLVVFLVTGVLVADLASRARRRATEAEQRGRESLLLARLSTALLSGSSLESELEPIGEDAAAILGVSQGEIRFEPPRRRPGRGWLALSAGERTVGTLYVPDDEVADEAACERFLPALASLLAVAGDRERLQREAMDAEALRRSDALKTALLRSVSHDLRSPLTAIRVAAESLSDPRLDLADADREQLLATVRAEGKRLDRVVGDLLELSRVQAGAVRPERGWRALDGILVQALSGLPGQERVVVRLPEELPLVDVDAGQIERVLANLIENALKFSGTESAVFVSAAADGNRVVVRVEDEGPGVAARDRELIFQPFERGRRRAAAGGSGLGLAIARGLATANGASVHCERGSGGGACFVLELPAVAIPIGLPA